MFSIALLALAASARAHSISHVRRHGHHVPRTQAPPAGWATGFLEPYDAYHERYTEIGCETKHNTTFFDSCCHPLLATETVAGNRPACCAVGATTACPGTAAPAETTAAAAPAETTAGQDEGDGEDCDDSDDEDDGEECDADDDNDEDEDDCDDDTEDESTSSKKATPSSTHTVSHTTKATHTTHTPAPTPSVSVSDSVSAPTGDKSASSNYITGGVGTWYMQDDEDGACGHRHSDNDFVVALQTQTYARGINCGRGIQICDLSNNKCVNGIVADECPTCDNPQSVDMSRAMFEGLAALSVGEFKIKWQFTSG
ncbi:RlpA-like double-psi beta-barrel-protein domain-containing protein-containing protein [Mycena haematopus]|nr:RlpA-like double-psi beta-barrel-protein domain-containing protein-containing protein [Mycena haematopus]